LRFCPSHLLAPLPPPTLNRLPRACCRARSTPKWPSAWRPMSSGASSPGSGGSRRTSRRSARGAGTSASRGAPTWTTTKCGSACWGLVGGAGAAGVAAQQGAVRGCMAPRDAPARWRRRELHSFCNLGIRGAWVCLNPNPLTRVMAGLMGRATAEALVSLGYKVSAWSRTPREHEVRLGGGGGGGGGVGWWGGGLYCLHPCKDVDLVAQVPPWVELTVGLRSPAPDT
jgi:hypothetical protein